MWALQQMDCVWASVAIGSISSQASESDGWKRASASSTEDKWVCCSTSEGKWQGDWVSFSRITNRWQPHPPLCLHVGTHALPWLILCMHAGMHDGGGGCTGEHAGGAQSGLKPFSGAFSQGPDHSLLGCPGFKPQNRKQLQFATSAACFTAPCSTQTTEDGVVTQPERRLDNACRSGGGSGGGIFISFMQRGKMLLYHGAHSSLLLWNPERTTFTQALSFLCAKSQVRHGPRAGPWEGLIDFFLRPLPLVVSSPWKLEQQSIEIW